MQVLRQLPKIEDPNVLVGNDSADDAAVYRLSDELGIVHTIDFFTPIVDDPYTYGEIAAANSLSDIYAMGATPLSALNVACFPIDDLSTDILGEILKGGATKAKEAGISIIGGHTVKDKEPKYGLAVIGLVHPAKIITNCNAKVGDNLVLTKKIGSGIISTAMKINMASEDLVKQSIDSMRQLNKAASKAMIKVGVNACTDITGFGLAGHLSEMLIGSNVKAELWMSKIPIFDKVLEYIDEGIVPGGTYANLSFLSEKIIIDKSLSNDYKLAICDAQTSGGLLISVSKEKTADLLRELELEGVEIRAVIGEIQEGDPQIILKP